MLRRRRRNAVSASESKILKGAFAGWKLDLINALNSKKGMLKSDVCVAVALVKHLNAGSYAAYPSQETLSDITDMSVRNVINCLERLREGGWIRWERGNRHKSNVYEFEEQKVADEIARMKADDRERSRRGRNRKKARPDMQPGSGQNEAATCTPVHVSTCTPVQPNTFMEHRGSEPAAVEDAA